MEVTLYTSPLFRAASARVKPGRRPWAISARPSSCISSPSTPCLEGLNNPFVLSLSKDAVRDIDIVGFYVYILHCADGSYYTGHTDDLESRMYAHYAGLVPGYTATRMPVSLEFSEEFPTRYEALERERQVKGWSRRKKEALIDRDWGLLRELSKSRGSTSSPRTD